MIPLAPSLTYQGVKNTISIPIAKIVVGRRRTLDQAKVEFMAESIKANGMHHPISVCALGNEIHLVAGLHRLEAAEKLDWRTIKAVKITEGYRELWELDENLVRAGLSADEEREQLKRRKEIWQKRRDECEAENSGAPCATIHRGRGRPKGFAAQFAGVTGKSKSQINRRLAEPKPHVVANGAGEPQPTERHQGLVVEIRRHLCDAQKAQSPSQ